MKLLRLLFFTLILHQQAFAQQDFFQPASAYNPQRLRTVIISEAITSTVITVGLDYLWYRKYPHSRFHFFNDNDEWLNMDKAGHATTAYNIAAVQSDLLHWAGMRRSQASVAGALTGLGFLTMLEIFDGSSAQWGFSPGDMLANISGCALYEGQQLLWGQQRISLKYSFHSTVFAGYHPEELGGNLLEQMLKDYNGQTYWLSFNISSFLPAGNSFPKWLNASFGYGAEGMISAVKNPAEIDGKEIPEFKRYRQFYFSPDVDLYRINNESPEIITLLKINRLLKMPAPAIEWNDVQGVKWHWLYY